MNEKLREEGSNTEVVYFKNSTQKNKSKHMTEIVCREGQSINNITFRTGIEPWKYEGKRTGRPRHASGDWPTSTLNELW